MSRTIQMKRGLLADLPQLLPGEFAFTIDTHEVFIGSADGNVPIVNSDKIRELELTYEEQAAALELTYAPELANLKSSDAITQSQLVAVNQAITAMNRGLGTTLSSMALLLSTYPTGDTKDHIVAGNIAEVDTLTVTGIPTTAGDVTVTLNGVAKTVPVTVGRAEVASLLVTAVPTVAGNVTVTLNGISQTVAIDPAVETTTDLVAAKIGGTFFSGWVANEVGSTITFTSTTTGTKTDAVYSAGTTGATGTMSTTTQGIAEATTTIVAAAIRAATYTGWTTGGTGSVVTFTATTPGTRAAPTFSGGTTGAAASLVRTIVGEASNYHRYFWDGSAWTDGGLHVAAEISEDQIFQITGLPDPQPKKSFTNGIANGDFSSGTSGYGSPSATRSVSNNVMSLTGNGSGIYPQLSTPSPTIKYVAGHKIFLRAKCKVLSAGCNEIKYFINSGGMGTLFATAQSAPVAGTQYTPSKIITLGAGGSANGTLTAYFAHYYPSAEAALGKVMELQNLMMLDLTEIFGTGNEPTESQVDYIIDHYDPVKLWFSGTQLIPTIGASNGKVLAEVDGIVKMASPEEFLTASKVPLLDTMGYYPTKNVEAALALTHGKVMEVYNPINESFTYSQGLKNVKDLLPTPSTSWQYTTSTFSGWGAPIGKAQNFNTLVFKIRNRAANTQPLTTIRAGVKVFNSLGATVLEKVYTNFNILPGEEKLVYFDFGQNIPNTALDELWAYFKCNQLIDVQYGGTSYNLNAPNYGNVAYFTNGNVEAGIVSKGDLWDPNLTNTLKPLLYVADSAYLYLPKQAFVDALGVPAAVASKVTVNLPDKYDLVVGDTFELFFKGIIMSNDPLQYNIKISCAKGQQFTKRYIFTPAVGDIGTHSMTISVYDDEEKLLGTKVTNLVVKAKAANPSTVKNVLNIGDSLTSGGRWPQELHHRLVELDGLSNLKFVGSKVIDGNVGYEGYGGWTYDSYTTNYADNSKVWANVAAHDKDASDQWSIYQDSIGAQWKIETIEALTIKMIRTLGTTALPASGTLTWISGGVHHDPIVYSSTSPESGNPFWNEDINAVDFANYAAELNVASIDYVNILLGWNSTGTGEETYKGKVRNFINLIRASFPNAKITLLGLQVPSLDGFGSSYGVSWNFYDKLKFVFNLDKWHKAVCSEFTGVDYVNVSGQFDTENNMPQSTRAVNVRNAKTEYYGTNGVHPADEGYLQIADAAYRNMNNKL